MEIGLERISLAKRSVSENKPRQRQHEQSKNCTERGKTVVTSKTANGTSDVVAAITTLHKYGLLEWKAECGAAQAELTVIVDENDDEHGNTVQFIRVSHDASPDPAFGEGDQIAEDFVIDSATYSLLVEGIVDLCER